MKAYDSTSNSSRYGLPADDVEEVCGALSELDERTFIQRRDSLRTMLEASLARYDSVMSRRLPSLAPGVKVKIVSGERTNQIVQVLDADYIAERALIELPDGPEEWVHFSTLGPP